jgi:hypothetical protein
MNRDRPYECPPTHMQYSFILGRDSNLTALQTAIIWPKVVETVCFQVSLYTFIMRSSSVVDRDRFDADPDTDPNFYDDADLNKSGSGLASE